MVYFFDHTIDELRTKFHNDPTTAPDSPASHHETPDWNTAIDMKWFIRAPAKQEI